MATLINRGRYCITVKNRDDLTRHFSHDKFNDAETYVEELRVQGFKPKAEQLDEHFLVRIRQAGFKPVNFTAKSRQEAETFVTQVTADRNRGLFVDYTASTRVTLADLIVRYLRDEAPKHKSHDVLAYSLEGWLADSGPQGVSLLEAHRDELRRNNKPVRQAKFKMRQSSGELHWIHKALFEVTTTDIEGFIEERLEVVAPATVDREIDRLKSIFKVATTVWNYHLAMDPMAAVRRPKYFNERDRRISSTEEARLVEALSKLDFERAVETRLKELADSVMAEQTFSSDSARKKVLAATRKALRSQAEESAHVVPYLEVFYYFQVMTAARRGETLELPWKYIDFEARTAFLPETKNGRARKLSLRQDLIAMLSELPRNTQHVFELGVDYIVGAWTAACKAAGIEDLHIHDARHEGISRVAESGNFSLSDLQQFSGHRDLRMLTRYTHLCASRLAGKLDECFSNPTKLREHKGRRYLSKAAGLSMASLTEQAETSASPAPAPVSLKPDTPAQQPEREMGNAEPSDASLFTFRELPAL